MKIFGALFGVGLGLLLLPAHAQLTPPPELAAAREPDGRLRLRPAAAGSFTLEEADSLTPSVRWRAATATTDLATTPPSFLVQPAAGTRFFRTVAGTAPPILTRIESTSPAAGETGVSVKRKAIFHFTAPLAAGVLLGRDNLHAESGGRAILARTELSFDRLQATLFPLEDLPAGAVVRVTLEAAGMVDIRNQLLDGDGDGEPGGRRVLEFETFNATPSAGTAVIGRVFASELVPGRDTGTNAVNRPLPGVTITVDGFEQTLRVVTDAAGRFTLNDCPAGRFFVHVDGRTAEGSEWPFGAYYPVVGKAWEAKLGVLTNPAAGSGEIFLPLIAANTLQPVSATQDTVITFPAAVLAANPALAGVQLRVPANSLFADNGARGGQVGIAAVPPDRLPEPLPPGLQFPLVITVQTDGAQNFDRPVPARFPNLPDPATGVKLPPGAKSGLWSFNHDTGRWELQGPMTISADGNFADTDPGVGIRQPGWHGPNRGSPPSLPPPPPEPPKKRDCEGKGSDYADDLLDLLAAAARCIGDLTDAVDDMRTMIHLATELREGVNNFVGLVETFNKEGAGGAEKARGLLQVANNLKGVAQDVIMLVQDKNPLSKAATAVNCAENVLNAADNICSRHVSSTDPCDSVAARTLCAGIAESKGSVAAINNLVEAAEGGLREVAVAGVCAVLELSIGHLGAYIQAEEGNRRGALPASLPQPAGPIPAGPIPAELRAALGAVVERQVSVNRGVDAMVPVNGGLADVRARTATVRRVTALEYFREFDFPNNAPFVIRVAGRELRDSIGSVGGPAFILPPDQTFELHLHLVAHNRLLAYHGTTASAGLPTEFSLEEFVPVPDGVDRDQDGLGELAEGVWGTAPQRADSDGDGVSDGAEVRVGSNPLDSLPVRTGIIASSARLVGDARDLTVNDGLAVLALWEGRVAVLEVRPGTNPVLLAQVETPVSALGVARSGNRVLVGAGRGGLVILDITDPVAARIAHRLPAGADESFAAVDAVDGRGYAGSSSGRILAVDLRTRDVLMTRTFPEVVEDLRVSGDYLYVLARTTLHVLALADLSPLGSVATPGTINGVTERKRLFVDGSIAYAVHADGYDTISVSDPLLPLLLKHTETPQGGWKQIVLNGSGLGIAAVSPAALFDSTDDVSLYNTRDPLKTDEFLTEFVTPGRARAVAIYRGQAYVGDTGQGLQVVNYLAYDSQGRPPTIQLSAGFPLAPARVEQGRRVFVRAVVTDDVQVRDVEFYHDGALAFTDGSYPFEHHFTAPRGVASFRLRAKATDTGGNATWTDEIIVALTPDVTGPRAEPLTPAENSTANEELYSVSAFFDQPITPDSVTAGAFQVYGPGPDSTLGTADDRLEAGSIKFNATGNTLVFTPAAVALASGSYRAVVRSVVRDLAGNLGTERAWNFTVDDQTRPKLTGLSPRPGERLDQAVRTVTVDFSEPPDPSTPASALTFTGFGPDDQLGTADDVVIQAVSIERRAAEFTLSFTLPAPLAAMRWRAELAPTVADLSGNRLMDPREWRFVVLPGTTVVGRAVFADGSPANGATVRIHERLRPLGTVAGGGFSFPGSAFDPGLRVTLDVHFESGGRAFLGQAHNVLPVPDGRTDFGTITLREVCAPQFDTTALPPATAPERVNAFVMFDDGSGPALYAAGQRSATDRGVYRRRGLRWERVGGAFTGFDQSTPYGVLALAVFNDGSGPALFAGGQFNAAGGTAAANLARWNGQQWRPVGNGVSGKTGTGAGFEAQVTAMLVHDAGTGPRLYVAGTFANPGYTIAAWDGQAWSALGTGIGGFIPYLSALAVFDEGQGPRLFATGQFLLHGSGPAGAIGYNIARWDGTAWSNLAGGLERDSAWQNASGLTLAVAAPGGGPPALFVGGTFTQAGRLAAPGIARWNGTAWSALAGGSVAPDAQIPRITALLPWTDARGSSLVAGGRLRRTDSTAVGVARWNGTDWTTLDGPAGAAVMKTGSPAALVATEASLFVGGALMSPEDTGAKLSPRGLVRWDGQLWQPADDALDGSIQSLAEFDRGQGPELYLGGNFVCGDGQRLHGMARMDAAGRLHPLGTGLKGIGSTTPSGPVALLAHDDGSGPALYVLGKFDGAGGGTTPDLARWSGTAWSSVGNARFTVGANPGALAALAVFDDGSGPSLFVGGQFNRVGSRSIAQLARWNGREWLAAGNPTDSTGVKALAVFDDGTEPALYLASNFGPRLQRWNGRSLLPVGDWATAFDLVPEPPFGFSVMDTLAGPMLHVAAQFYDPATQGRVPGVARWNGAAWQQLPPVPGGRDATFGRPQTFDDGFGPALYVVRNRDGSNWIRWNGADWESLPEGTGDALRGITSPFLPANPGATPAVWFGGFWEHEGGKSFLLRWNRPLTPCP